MNAEQLLHYFDQIADEPDAVARLRRFILDLAVRGKMVEQVSNDEPAAELVKRITIERVRLAKISKIQKEKPIFPIEEDEVPFAIPQNWKWVRLCSITSYIQRGKSPQYTNEGGPLVISQRCVQWDGLHLEWAKVITPESLNSYEPVRFIRDGDLLWNSTGTGTIGRLIRVEQPNERLVCDSHVTVVRCLGVNERFVQIWLRSDHVYGSIEGKATGATNQVELTATMANNQVTPLPPLAEQQRIVAKVDELMALCDELEAAQAQRETRRDQLVAATLHSLANDPVGHVSGVANGPGATNGFAERARFYFNHLPRLTTRPEHIKQLRQTILNLAVRGKLVEIQKDEEITQATLQDLLSQRLRLHTDNKDKIEISGEIKLVENALARDTNVNPYVTARCICDHITKGTTPQANELQSMGDIPYIKVYNIRNNQIDFTYRPTYISQEVHEKKLGRSKVYPGDILMNIVGPPLGKVAIVPEDFKEWNINQALAIFRPIPLIDRRFFYMVLSCQTTLDEILADTHGTAGQDNLSLEQCRSIKIPLYTLSYQQRIVAKVDELMALCDALEAQLTTNAATRRQLLEATLHAALKEGP